MESHPAIIAAVDFSSSSPQVLAHAAKLAACSGAPVIAVHVISESRLKDWEETMGMEATTADRVKEVSAHLRKLVNEGCGDIPAGITVRIGKPYEVLLSVVNEQGADLVILGAHDVTRRRLGAVSARCARSLPADVLILRDWQGRSIRRIAACVDFYNASAAGLHRAISIAKAHQASLEIIHVMFPPSHDPWGRMIEQRMDDETSYDATVQGRVKARMADFLTPFADHLAGLETTTTILEGESPAAAITAHVEAEGIDLTVIGSHAGSWVEDFVLGSNAERLLHDSCSSVLVTRARIPEPVSASGLI